MRLFIAFLFPFFFIFQCAAQSDTVFVNELGTYVSREQASYYRLVIPTDRNTYLLTDYFFNHQLARSVEYKSKLGSIREGDAVYFFSTGIKKEEGRFHHGFPMGEWRSYYANGSMKERKIFTETLATYYTYQFDSSSSQIEEEGAYDLFGKKTGTWKRYFWKSEQLQSETHYVVGKKQGEQIEYYLSGAIKRKEYFENNKVKKGFQYDMLGNKIHYFPAFEYPVSKKPIYRVLQNEVPCYAEQVSLHPFNLCFLVTKAGEVKNIEIEMTDEACKSELKKVIEKMKWKPAKKENQWIDYPVNFRMRTYGNGD
jgi:antitoxin component YwqK of YwqJK toxin-antitoxin module